MRVPLLLLAYPVMATLAGGLLTIRLHRFRSLLVALGAGLLLGAAFLDLLPEAIAIGGGAGLSASDVLGLTLLFFLVFSVLESALDLLYARLQEGSGGGQVGTRSRRAAGRIAGGMLIFHSFRDGMAIGAAFAASHLAGYAVTMGIVAHDFADGMNTVILTTAGEKARRADYLFLAADALAPFLGGLLTVWWLLSSRQAAIFLALAAGFFLQMATGDFLPQLKREPRGRMLLVVGVAMIYGANVLLNWRAF